MAKPSMTELLGGERNSMANPIGCCGHHCGFCGHKMCGGCRSAYAGTSFKQACGGSCPNIMCSREKGLEGCYACGELPGCKKGYYAKEKEYVAKAAALFVKKHGGESYTSVLRGAVAAGKKYAQSFDKAGSVEGALEMLEGYMGKSTVEQAGRAAGADGRNT